MAKELKKYRFREGRGQHYMPNPNYTEGKDQPSESHVAISPGDIVLLTDDQYAAFRDKFTPVDEDATGIKDAENKKLEDAKVLAKATGEAVDPNKPVNPHDQEILNTMSKTAEMQKQAHQGAKISDARK